MSIAFVRFGCIFPLTTPSAIELSVCKGVGGCGCLISLSMILMYTASRAIMQRAASSASVAEVITCLMMCAILSKAPLLVGISPPLERKKMSSCPALRFGFAEVAGIAMGCQFHFACVICDHCLVLCSQIVK